VNWAILVSGFACFIARFRVARWVTFGLCVGFGAVTAILWELLEYVTFVRTNPNELRDVYHDTLGDLGLGLTGSALAALLFATVLWRSPTTARRASRAPVR
jgi:hypothetical protein